MDDVSKKALSEIYPELARRWNAADALLQAMGINNRIDQGLRTWPQQTILWFKGRNPDGSFIDPIHHSGVVTHAKAGESYHNYGLAIDFVPMVDGMAIWDRENAAYAKTIEVAEGYGLISGSRWPEPKKDFPHLELPGKFPENAPDSYCRYLFTEGGLRAVWDEVDKALGITKVI